MRSPIQSFYTWYRQVLRNSRFRWLLIVGTVLYLLSPIDIAPDIIPIVGWIDDGLLITLLVSELSQMAMDWLGRSTQTRPQEKSDGPVIDVTAREN
ncbi:hypothetical protein XM38_000260 [Halomicronema hongdechloris C2206]|uniref:DUF1232 domain-containing protein n=1 Tax=Halomicronema hongdechloris C2206 TaxID=1641165 RepID=A0A1Z3HFP5_9CYAN|nr:DUF1232 domain-containing protein [Halomicronema hongdechloris]ASC69100.1 hypothetical protein XM38_000260 [Halomicronema hongdechloris C2206]